MATVGVNPDGSLRNRMDQLPRQASLVDLPEVCSGCCLGLITAGLAKAGPLCQGCVPPFGPTTTSFPAETGNRGALNPAHSRWLMGFPIEWDACGVTVTLSSRRSRRHL